MAWSNLFSISCSINCRLDGSIIFPCWWWVKAFNIFINYDYLSYQFCDSWTYPMCVTVRFRVSRTGPCPCPSISDYNYALIESNDMTKIFLYSWRREHHFQPCLWICPKSQGPLMFQARLKLFFKHIYFHIFVLEKYAGDNFVLKFYFWEFLWPIRFSHTFECLGI